MKPYSHSPAWIRSSIPNDGAATNRRSLVAGRARRKRARVASTGCQSSSSGGISASLRVVGVLAFCQAIFFLVLFLFLCARAGAATENKSEHGLELIPSTYTIQSTRDPFGAQAVGAPVTNGTPTVASVDTSTLKLTGILYDAVRPSALVNDQLLELNRAVRMPTAQGEVEVKALSITRERVVLQVGGQKVELRLGGGDPN
ncbi:MAG TPA: hypothetical protein VMP11_17700 [Verrucomicrobiae bacterium]|nr:hypothetical protein [Verrucomicrobiae bacterium]